jgi:hypothetical protein
MPKPTRNEVSVGSQSIQLGKRRVATHSSARSQASAENAHVDNFLSAPERDLSSLRVRD